MDLWQQINDLNILLNETIQDVKSTGKKYAEAYTRYRVLLAQKLLILKNEGMPVTMANDVARGDTSVATAKLEEIENEAIHRATLESINALKLRIKILQEQYNKEWGQSKNE